MLKEAGYPGMNVLEFAFYGGEDSNYLPHNYVKNSVTYIGTHDNDTALGWYKSLEKADRKFAKRYMNLTKKEGICGGLIRTAFGSISDLVVIQMQDYLQLGSEARMNIPSTIGGGNWAWRMSENALNKKLSKKIRRYAKTYFRLPVEVKEEIAEETNEAETNREAEQLVQRSRAGGVEGQSPSSLSAESEISQEAKAESPII